MNKILFYVALIVAFLPFILFAFFNAKANTKKDVRHQQFAMPLVAVAYSTVLLIFLSKLSNFVTQKFLWLVGLLDKIKLGFIGNFIKNIYTSWGIYVSLILFNTAALVLYVIIKRILTLIMSKTKVRPDTFIGKAVGLFYTYDESVEQWFIKNHYGQARTFIKAAYYGSCFASALALLVSCGLCMRHLVSAPFYPVFAVMIIGEMAFFIDGIGTDEEKSSLSVTADNSRLIAMYPMLRKPLKILFGDKLSADGTTVNMGSATGGAIEDILANLQKEGGHIGKNYARFIRKKMDGGLKPNVDYVRSGYDLATGKSLLFNTPFYDKLNPYLFYAMNRELLTGGKILVVLGRHGTEGDLQRWISKSMEDLCNIPDLWKIKILDSTKTDEEDLPDIGIITRSGVHDLDIQKNSLPFLQKVSFVFIVEPSRLVTTAQIGLNLLIKECGYERSITFASVDRNCDGLVDALSHILMTNITEVSATEYPHGMSSYMYWTADGDYLQHRILPGVSRCLGMGTELSMVALKNQVKKTVWYGGEAFPVLDARWIAKQYYYDLMDYAKLPTNQEAFDQYFQTSFNMCDERVSKLSYITVEDDRNNLFETRRNFATIAEEQGFVNVISSEYMLREYMASNPELFTADAKAIPYITADYARTKRNAILSLCLLLCVDSVKQELLERQMVMLNVDTRDPISVIWNEVCVIFGCGTQEDKHGNPILTCKTRDGKTVSFQKDETILFKRAYCVESGQFESVYTVENKDFSQIILDDLRNATYIAEQESRDVYLGTELKGHVYQKYLPGQFFTLNGKYYEMISTTVDNRILVRRASEHIGGRLSYRQVRNYTIHHLENADTMGALKTVNNIGIHYQFADFSVETPGYWKMRMHNDFDNGDLVKLNGVPGREYHHKQIVKFDFSKLGDAFTDSVRMTLTNLLNEAFVTLFAENHPFICALTPGQFDAPLTYSLNLEEGVENDEKCIFIVEDSQLDIGLLIAVERNLNRIMQIIADYLLWNQEQIAESIRKMQPVAAAKQTAVAFDAFSKAETPKKEKKKKGLFGWIKGLFKKKDKTEGQEETEGKKKGLFGRFKKKKPEGEEETEGKKKGFFAWLKGLFKRKKKDQKPAEGTEELTEEPSEEGTEEGAEPIAEPGTEIVAEPTDEPAEPTEESAKEPAAESDFEGMTPKERKKAQKEAAKAAKKAAREQKKAQKLEEKQRKAAEKAAAKEAKAAGDSQAEPAAEEEPTVEPSQDVQAEANEGEVSENA